MRAGIEHWILKQWYETRQPPWYLRMLEPVYLAAFNHERKKGESGMPPCRSGLPLIVVGNITTGGSGKTPLVIRLCQIARELNLKPGIASTGYGRQSKETLVVHAGSDTRECGDEPVLLAKRTGVPVVVAARRCDAISKLNDMGLDLLFSDDGLQQSDLARDIEFCVVDGARGLGNGHLLPAGPLREPVGRLSQVDYVVTNGAWAGRPEGLSVNIMQLVADSVCSLDGSTVMSAEQFRQNLDGRVVHAFAGIGHPQRFFRTLESLQISANSHAFPDHHRFSDKDFDLTGPGSVIIMTEKDAVKCRSLGLKDAWYVPVDTRLDDDFEATFKRHLLSLTKESK